MNEDGCGDVVRRYEEVKGRVAAAAERSGRSPDRIYLVAVTKHASPSQVRTLHHAGHADFGESRMQHFVRLASQIDEYRGRQRDLHGDESLPESVRWHFIGHLQRNKVRRIMSTARLTHSIDSLRLAEEIQRTHVEEESPAEVLVQVNVAGERSKHGVAPAAAPHLVDQIRTMLGVRVRGLMCMAPRVEDPEEVRPVFKRAREIFDEIQRHSEGSFDLLSMGMSDDFEVAIECGANIVRVGTAIFGTPEEIAATAAAHGEEVG